MISPPTRVASALQVGALMVFLKKRTEPSSIPTFTPPGWFDEAPMTVLAGCRPWFLKSQDRWSGVVMCV